MTALKEFRAGLPAWRAAVEDWMDRQPAWFRNDPAWAGSVYLLNSPPLVAIGSMSLKSVEEGWINWQELLRRTGLDGRVETVLARAAYQLAAGDPGPALGLMLVFPHVEAFQWAHAAGVLFQLVEDRVQRHPLSA